MMMVVVVFVRDGIWMLLDRLVSRALDFRICLLPRFWCGDGETW